MSLHVSFVDLVHKNPFYSFMFVLFLFKARVKRKIISFNVAIDIKFAALLFFKVIIPGCIYKTLSLCNKGENFANGSAFIPMQLTHYQVCLTWEKTKALFCFWKIKKTSIHCQIHYFDDIPPWKPTYCEYLFVSTQFGGLIFPQNEVK